MKVTTYRDMYEKEKLRADLLQDDLNSVDILHFDECASLNAELALIKQENERLKRKLKLKGCH